MNLFYTTYAKMNLKQIRPTCKIKLLRKKIDLNFHQNYKKQENW